jgi:riboflavin synthase
MFTGIVAGVGLIKKINRYQAHSSITVRAPFRLKRMKPGDSIAVDGCCLTVTRLKGKEFDADLSPETLKRTTLGTLKKGSKVNLETPLRMGDPLGGHWVQGHVDGIGKITASRLVKARPSAYYLLKVEVPKPLLPYMIEKGSVAVDGISLTINGVKNGRIDLCIIPHTQQRTALTEKKPGARLNIEADILLKFAERSMASLNRVKK